MHWGPRFRCNIPADRLHIYWRCGNGMMWNGYSSASPQPDSAGLLTKRRPWGNLSELCWLMKKQCCHMLWCTSQLCQELPPTFWQLKSREHTCMDMYRYSMVIHILDFFLLLGLCQNLLRDIVPKRIWQWESETWGPYPAAVLGLCQICLGTLSLSRLHYAAAGYGAYVSLSHCKIRLGTMSLSRFGHKPSITFFGSLTSLFIFPKHLH